ncbi:MAG: hypothetical protein Q8Q09_22230 [Deltaproteobacteria bacterium]|nr:hypothetical protein [Deltaproteobacteria bacterium]
MHTAPSPSATTPVRANRSLAAPVALVVLLLGGSMAATVALSNDTRLHSEHRAAERPTTLSAPHAYNSPAGSSAVESPESVLARWDDSVQHPVGHAFEDMYTPFASIHGSRQTPDRNVAEALRGTWRGRIADGGWFRSQRRVRNEDLPSRRPSEAARVCVDPENPNARVVRFLAHAEWRDPSASRNRNVPCEELRGTFVWRLVETTAGWRICQESWDIADAICLSCPQASVCAQR